MKGQREKAVRTEALWRGRAHDSRLGAPVARSLHLCSQDIFKDTLVG